MVRAKERARFPHSFELINTFAKIQSQLATVLLFIFFFIIPLLRLVEFLGTTLLYPSQFPQLYYEMYFSKLSCTHSNYYLIHIRGTGPREKQRERESANVCWSGWLVVDALCTSAFHFILLKINRIKLQIPKTMRPQFVCVNCVWGNYIYIFHSKGDPQSCVICLDDEVVVLVLRLSLSNCANAQNVWVCVCVCDQDYMIMNVINYKLRIESGYNISLCMISYVCLSSSHNSVRFSPITAKNKQYKKTNALLPAKPPPPPPRASQTGPAATPPVGPTHTITTRKRKNHTSHIAISVVQRPCVYTSTGT